jgi:hypothetical protein
MGSFFDGTYNADQILEIRNNVVKNARLRFEKDGLNGLARYIAIRFPQPTFETHTPVPVPNANKYFETVDHFFDRLSPAINDIAIDVRTSTTPRGVEITLSTGKFTVRKTVSNIGFRNLYRGIYDISATKPSYKGFSETVDGTDNKKGGLDLVDASPSVIECVLVAKESRGGSECHQR